MQEKLFFWQFTTQKFIYTVTKMLNSVITNSSRWIKYLTVGLDVKIFLIFYMLASFEITSDFNNATSGFTQRPSGQK